MTNRRERGRGGIADGKRMWVEISLHGRFPATFGRLPNTRALIRSFTFDDRQIATKRSFS